jgi:membrane-bound lytic murein transglycosylase A
VSFARRALAFVPFALLAACATQPVAPPVVLPPAPAPLPLPKPTPPPPTYPPAAPTAATSARAAGIALAQPKLLRTEEAARALAAFRTSCPVIVRRTDTSGLTQGEDWRGVCAEAATLAPEHSAGFFFHRFDWVRVWDGRAFATGYYEPELEGSRVAQQGYAPIYRPPPDLVRCTRPDGGTGRGRIGPDGVCRLYFTRAEIEDGALAGRGLELAWAKDPVELFFLEIQGSGRVLMPDGSVMRVGYASQNGRDYVAIGRLLRERGVLPPGGANMAAIKNWIRSNPAEGRALLRENPSFVFFRELTGPGPLGSINVPVTPRATVAVDPRFVPYGAPVYLTMDRPEPNGIWVAQDTGGAIKGPNRFDTFWGAGTQAVELAGSMSATGEALLLLPRGVAARALAQP